MKFLITGGAGFIGGHLTEFLSKKYFVTVIDNLSHGNKIKCKNKCKMQCKNKSNAKINADINAKLNAKGFLRI